MKKNIRKLRGFTLIELMVVVVIIIILAGMILSGSMSIKRQGRLSKAKVEATTIETAIKAYRIEYGKWPGVEEDADNFEESGTPNETNHIDIMEFREHNERVFEHLRPDDSDNPRHILFVEQEAFSRDNTGTVLTPWGAMGWFDSDGDNAERNYYKITIDKNYPASGGKGVTVGYYVPRDGERESGFDDEDVDDGVD